MPKTFGIKLRKFLGICPLNLTGEEYQFNNFIVVETDRGIECGQIVIIQQGSSRIERKVQVRKIIRKFTPEDFKNLHRLEEFEKESFITCTKKIREHELPIKLVSIEYLFDHNKVTLYYKIEDEKKSRHLKLREFVRDIGTVLKRQVELHQIGGRGGAKILGGLGPCGRNLCCASWLAKSKPITIKMVKEQNLSFNLTKISGLCGRLMCCLRFEQGVCQELSTSEKKELIQEFGRKQSS